MSRMVFMSMPCPPCRRRSPRWWRPAPWRSRKLLSTLTACPWPGFGPDVERLAHQAHQRLEALVARRGQASMMAIVALSAPEVPPETGRIDVLDAGRGEQRGARLRGLDADGGGVDHRLDLARPARRRARAPRPPTLAVGQRQDDGVGACGDLGVALGDGGAGAAPPCSPHRRPPAVARRRQVPAHAVAHAADADPADRFFISRLLLFFPRGLRCPMVIAPGRQRHAHRDVAARRIIPVHSGCAAKDFPPDSAGVRLTQQGPCWSTRLKKNVA